MVVNNITDAYQTVQIVRGGEDGSKVAGCQNKWSKEMVRATSVSLVNFDCAVDSPHKGVRGQKADSSRQETVDSTSEEAVAEE